MILLDGKTLSAQLKEELRLEIEKIKAENGKIPCLAAVLVGNDAASEAYVGSKVRLCEQVGFHSKLIRMTAETTENELLAVIQMLNNDAAIDGYIVQLPLPKHIDENRILLAIAPEKDVDGFHPLNFGRMAQGLPCYIPATPYGMLQMLERYGVETSGKHAVVIGRSNIVGTPMSLLLSRKGKDCTVTLTHSRTRDLAAEVRRADIVVAAIGIPKFVTADMIKEGAVVLDVGINRIADPTAKNGSRLVGDVDFENVAPKCSFITPVPGGVGLLTVIALLQNTLKAARKEIYT